MIGDDEEERRYKEKIDKKRRTKRERKSKQKVEKRGNKVNFYSDLRISLHVRLLEVID